MNKEGGKEERKEEDRQDEMEEVENERKRFLLRHVGSWSGLITSELFLIAEQSDLDGFRLHKMEEK